MHDLGVSDSLTLSDIWSIDDPIQMSFIPRPVFALILVLPTSDEYERHRQSTQIPDEVIGKKTRKETDEILWIQQTIDNACGLYALIHATCNFEVKKFIGMCVRPHKTFLALSKFPSIRPRIFFEQVNCLPK